jgi:hypothetical protein
MVTFNQSNSNKLLSLICQTYWSNIYILTHSAFCRKIQANFDGCPRRLFGLTSPWHAFPRVSRFPPFLSPRLRRTAIAMHSTRALPQFAPTDEQNRANRSKKDPAVTENRARKVVQKIDPPSKNAIAFEKVSARSQFCVFSPETCAESKLHRFVSVARTPWERLRRL